MESWRARLRVVGLGVGAHTRKVCRGRACELLPRKSMHDDWTNGYVSDVSGEGGKTSPPLPVPPIRNITPPLVSILEPVPDPRGILTHSQPSEARQRQRQQ